MAERHPLGDRATMAEMAQAWGRQYDDIRYVIRSRKLTPIAREGRTLFYDHSAQEIILEALAYFDKFPRQLDKARELHHQRELWAEKERWEHEYIRAEEAETLAREAVARCQEYQKTLEAVLALQQSPDYPQVLQALQVFQVLRQPGEIPLAAVAEATLFCATVANVLAQRCNGEPDAYAHLVQAIAQQPLQNLAGELHGTLFTLATLLHAAMDVHQARQGETSAEVLNLEQTLTSTLSQLKRWANDAMPWLSERVRPHAPEPMPLDDAPSTIERV